MKGEKLLLSIGLTIFLPMFLLLCVEEFIEAQKLDNWDGLVWSTTEQDTSSIRAGIDEDKRVSLLLQDGTIMEMSIESYLVGVLLEEMPADFDEQALMAQAIAARTYALKTIGSGLKHSQGMLCDDHSCCQGYCDKEKYLAAGGSRFSVEKMESVVNETKSLVLFYDGKLIDATYFSCSGGMTEAAEAVWGEDIAYLQAVESPGEEASEYFTESTIISREEFQMLIGQQLDIYPENWFGQITYTQGGGVDTIEIGGKQYQGTELRSILNLRSTAFSISGVGEAIIITTKGFGHRVGMSQYGAEAMAVQGASYEEILSYYYPGTSIETFVG